MARGSKFLARSYVLLLVLFGLAFLSACVASPFLKVLNDELGKSRPLGKLFTQSLVVFSLLYFILFRRFMHSRVVESLNLRLSSVLTHLLAGLAVGALTLGVIIAIFTLAGAKRYDPNFAADMIGKALLTGLAVGVLEEIIFRGVVLQNLQADMETFFAVVFASAFFAAMHFVAPMPSDILADGAAPSFERFHILNGFRLLPYQLSSFGHLDRIWPFALGLFLVGVALSAAYVKTGSLYLPIGIHAGFVAVSKLDGALFHNVAERSKLSKLFFGVPKDWYMSYTDSLITWLVAVVLIVLLSMYAKKPPLRAGRAKER